MMGAVTSRTEEINSTHLDTIDWSRAAFPIGVLVGGNRPWLGLSLNEMKLLRNLLTKSIPLAQTMNDGTVVVEELEPAVEVGEGLAAIATWLTAAIAWKTRNPEK